MTYTILYFYLSRVIPIYLILYLDITPL